MRGDPKSPLRWTTKSTRHLPGEPTGQGHRVSAETVADLLREEGFSLQGNAKTAEGRQHPDCEGQFRYINERARDHQAAGDPVVGVDTKKEEVVGNYKNTGSEWHPAGEPARVADLRLPGPGAGQGHQGPPRRGEPRDRLRARRSGADRALRPPLVARPRRRLSPHIR
ncbi:hypothetical protein GTZ85_02945 [Streptomyces sp. SID5474]|nr:hypothetical protein [Streptomyces sp. SID5474]